MRTTFLAVLLGSTALAASALAQSQPQVTPTQVTPTQVTPTQVTPAQVPEGQAQAKAAIAECDRLIAFLNPNRPTGGITVERAQEWRTNSDAASCKSALDRLTQASAGESQPQPTVAGSPSHSQPAAPAASASGSTLPVPQVVVQQQQPSVTVRQAKPEIIVRMPPPVITVQQPQPEIIVRMPEPDVDVAVARPEVQVTIPQPQVQVQPPGPQANVQVERQEPNVRIERTGEPQIVYQQADGQPQIRFEPLGGGQAGQPATAAAPAADPQRAQAQPNNPQTGYATHTPTGAAVTRNQQEAASAPQTTGALPAADLQAVTVSKLEDMTLYNGREEKLGEVEAVVSGAGGRTLLVISHGGFLGLGEKRVAIPAEQVALRGDRLVADGLSDDQIRALPSYERNAGLRELEDAQTAQIRTLR